MSWRAPPAVGVSQVEGRTRASLREGTQLDHAFREHSKIKIWIHSSRTRTRRRRRCWTLRRTRPRKDKVLFFSALNSTSPRLRVEGLSPLSPSLPALDTTRTISIR